MGSSTTEAPKHRSVPTVVKPPPVVMQQSEDIIEEDEIAEHGDETQKSKSSHNVDHNIFQIELSLNCFG